MNKTKTSSFLSLNVLAGLTRPLKNGSPSGARWRFKPDMTKELSSTSDDMPMVITREATKHTPSPSQEGKRDVKAAQEKWNHVTPLLRGVGGVLRNSTIGQKRARRVWHQSLTPLLLLIAFALGISSCNRLLEVKPDNRRLINTLDDMQATLRGLALDANYWFTDYMTDNYTYREGSREATEQLAAAYTFRITRESLPNAEAGNLYSANLSWENYYRRLQNAVLVIDRATKYPAHPKGAKRRNAILGTALAIRAYCHFMLVNLFAPPYEEATKATPGIPLVRAYTGKGVETYPVVSVQETYEAIEQDLLKALPLMDDSQWKNTKYNFNKTAVYALTARFYLFKQAWQKAVHYADSVIARNTNLLNINTLPSQPPSDYGKQYFHPDNKSYLLMSDETTQFLASGSYFFPYPLEAYFKSLGIDTDKRFSLGGALFKDIAPKKLFPFKGSFNAGTYPLLSVDETYYNRAEAYIRLGKLNPAKQDLKRLLAHDDFAANPKWTNKLNGINHPDTLMSYLLNNKRIRFFAEGMRWFDIRRHRLPVTHEMKGETFSIDGKDPKAYAIKFPLNEMNFR